MRKTGKAERSKTHKTMNTQTKYTRFQVWRQSLAGLDRSQLVGTYDTKEEALEAARLEKAKCDDEGNYWAEMYGENDRFFVVEEGLRPTKLKQILEGKSNGNQYMV